MTDDIRDAASSGAQRTQPDPDHGDHHGPADGHVAARGVGTSHAVTDADTTDTATTTTTPGSDATVSPNAPDALASLRALDSDRNAVNSRLVTSSTVMWNAALTGVVVAVNAAAYWFLSWTVLGGHGTFTWTEYWIYIGVALLICTLSAILLSYAQKHSGIGVWNSRLFWPGNRLMRNGRYRRIFLVYLTFALATPVAMALIGALYAPWWPVVTLAPLCGLVSAWLSRLQVGAYTRTITTPLAPDAPNVPDMSNATHETEAPHDLG